MKGEPYEPRRVIIVIGDGHDNASKHNLEEVLELAQRNLVTIYAVSTMAFGFSNESQDVLERLTHKTGGHVEYPLNSLYKDVSGYLSNPSDDGNYALTVGTGGYAAEISNGIIKAVGGIGGEITTQYILRYKPDIDPEAKPKQYRKITVDIPGLAQREDQRARRLLPQRNSQLPEAQPQAPKPPPAIRPRRAPWAGGRKRDISRKDAKSAEKDTQRRTVLVFCAPFFALFASLREML